jgi:hypothetical protein
MKDNKEIPNSQKDCENIAREIRRSLHPIDDVSQWELQVLDSIFDESRNHPEEFQQMYVKPLLNEGVAIDTAFQLLVEGVFRPN